MGIADERLAVILSEGVPAPSAPLCDKERYELAREVKWLRDEIDKIYNKLIPSTVYERY